MFVCETTRLPKLYTHSQILKKKDQKKLYGCIFVINDDTAYQNNNLTSRSVNILRHGVDIIQICLRQDYSYTVAIK